MPPVLGAQNLEASCLLMHEVFQQIKGKLKMVPEYNGQNGLTMPD
jgi:hypothetical protein